MPCDFIPFPPNYLLHIISPSSRPLHLIPFFVSSHLFAISSIPSPPSRPLLPSPPSRPLLSVSSRPVSSVPSTPSHPHPPVSSVPSLPSRPFRPIPSAECSLPTTTETNGDHKYLHDLVSLPSRPLLPIPSVRSPYPISFIPSNPPSFPSWPPRHSPIFSPVSLYVSSSISPCLLPYLLPSLLYIYPFVSSSNSPFIISPRPAPALERCLITACCNVQIYISERKISR